MKTKEEEIFHQDGGTSRPLRQYPTVNINININTNTFKCNRNFSNSISLSIQIHRSSVFAIVSIGSLSGRTGE